MQADVLLLCANTFRLQTFLCNALFVILVPVYEALTWLRRRKRLPPHNRDDDPDEGGDVERQPLVGDTISTSSGAIRSIQNGNEVIAEPGGASGAGVVISRLQTLKLAAGILPLWFIAQWSFNVSLALTSVTSNTIISSTASLWTLVLATMFAGEKFTYYKLLGVLCCVGGTAIVSVGDAGSSSSNGTAGNTNHSHNGTNHSNRSGGGGGGGGGGRDGKHATLYGNLICLASTVVYACYTAALRRWGSSKDCSMMLMFGYVGLLSIFLVGPFVLLLGKLGTYVRAASPARTAAPYSFLPPCFLSFF